MSAIVGPSQRVCSRPTLVSTTTGASSTLVASQRPPRPASITATSPPRRASSYRAGGGERAGLDVGGGDPDPLGEGRQVRRQVGAGAQAVRLQDRRRHPHGRG